MGKAHGEEGLEVVRHRGKKVEAASCTICFTVSAEGALIKGGSGVVVAFCRRRKDERRGCRWMWEGMQHGGIIVREVEGFLVQPSRSLVEGVVGWWSRCICVVSSSTEWCGGCRGTAVLSRCQRSGVGGVEGVGRVGRIVHWSGSGREGGGPNKRWRGEIRRVCSNAE